LIAAPAAWSATTQLGQILPYRDCRMDTSYSLVVAGLALIVSLGSVVVSYPKAAADNRPNSFVAYLSVGTGLVFLFALLLQVTAAAVLNRCQR
jgi:hypothetical protein